MRLPPRITRVVLGCTLAAACLVACDPQPTGPPPSPPAPPEITSADATTCAPPACDQIVATVDLAWRPSTSPIAGYRVLRDGEEIASLPPIGPVSTSVEDRSAVIGATHRYEVVAVGDDGTRGLSAPASVVVPLPPVEAAQVEGAFRVTRRVTRAKNLKELEGIAHPPGSRGRSPSGPSLRRARPPSAPARSDGTAIRACWCRTAASTAGTPLPGSRDVPAAGASGARIRVPFLWVTEARVVGGAWVASEIRGRLSSAFACPGFAPSSGAARYAGVRR